MTFTLTSTQSTLQRLECFGRRELIVAYWRGGMAEDEADHALRKLAMSKKLHLGDVAQPLIDSADLLGKT